MIKNTLMSLFLAATMVLQMPSQGHAKSHSALPINTQGSSGLSVDDPENSSLEIGSLHAEAVISAYRQVPGVSRQEITTLNNAYSQLKTRIEDPTFNDLFRFISSDRRKVSEIQSADATSCLVGAVAAVVLGLLTLDRMGKEQAKKDKEETRVYREGRNCKRKTSLLKDILREREAENQTAQAYESSPITN